MSEQRSVERHYGRPGLEQRVLGALDQAGVPAQGAEADDLAPLDEFHLGGRSATDELIEAAGLRAGMRVVDVGSGLGGPARRVAARCGCRVVGVDAAAAYCRLANALTQRVGMQGRAVFYQADALALPFGDGEFDAAWLQHVTMNIEGKGELFAELSRVVREGGALALWEICAGEGGAVHTPVPWAEEPSLSFLVPPERMRALLEGSGWRIGMWEERSDACLQWVRERIEAMKRAPVDGPPPLGIGLLMGETAKEKILNLERNLAEGRIRVVRSILRRG